MIIAGTNQFRGMLTNGFFDNEIYAPPGKTFPNEQPDDWSWDPETLADSYPNTKGNLDEYVNRTSKWSWRIISNYPTGIHTVKMRIHNHLGVNNRPVVDEKDDTFTVV